jgi:hypothetical protein
MAKNKKKSSVVKSSSRLRDLAAMAVVLVPAILAALTAFMNTAFARDNGLSWEDAGLSDPSSKSRKRAKRS